jgi:quercetin dioxygenase-like cupin family protein
MRILSFAPDTGRPIDRFGSTNAAVTHVARDLHGAFVVCLHIAPRGVIGRHQTMGPQLFLVVRGEGWVSGEDGGRRWIATGQAAFWEAGEWHESGSDTGMTVIVVDSTEPGAVVPDLVEVVRPQGAEPGTAGFTP